MKIGNAELARERSKTSLWIGRVKPRSALRTTTLCLIGDVLATIAYSIAKAST